MSKFTVWRLYTSPEGDNQYGISRREVWSFIKVADFADEETARDYVRTESLAKTTLPLYTIDVHSTLAKQKFINDFCFDDDKYMAQRRYFLESPKMVKPAIVEALAKVGIRVQA